jgi:hypothetical protein
VLSTKNDEAQFIESRKFLIAEFSRYLDVTPHRLSDMEKSSYNNMEQMSLETVVYSLTPWVKRWEQCSYRDLLTEDDKAAGRFIEFALDGLLRGDTNARSAFYQSGVNTGWLTRNEVREKENLNPLEGLDKPLQPQNMAPVGEQPSEPPPPAAQARAIAQAAAERVVRREKQAIINWKQRASGDDAAWRAHVETFYREHSEFVSKAMAMDIERARKWCECQRDTVLRLGPGTIDTGANDGSIALLVMEALRA